MHKLKQLFVLRNIPQTKNSFSVLRNIAQIFSAHTQKNNFSILRNTPQVAKATEGKEIRQQADILCPKGREVIRPKNCYRIPEVKVVNQLVSLIQAQLKPQSKVLFLQS